MALQVKICGLRSAMAVNAAVDGGAAFVGFVFFPPSPRHIASDDAAVLAESVPDHVTRTGLFVDPGDDLLEAVLARVPLDLIQLHGKESPERVAAVRDRFELPVMKAISVAGPADLALARTYEVAADHLLFDAKPPPEADRPGGNALAFDWRLLHGETWSKPWMLAGGLNPDNLAEAVRISGAAAVDVSSGVEDAPGEKSLPLIHEFLKVAATL